MQSCVCLLALELALLLDSLQNLLLNTSNLSCARFARATCLPPLPSILPFPTQELLHGRLRSLSRQPPSLRFPFLRLLSALAAGLGPVLEAARAGQHGPGGVGSQVAAAGARGGGGGGGVCRAPSGGGRSVLVCRRARLLVTAAHNELGSPCSSRSSSSDSP